MVTISQQLESLHGALRALCVVQISPPAEDSAEAIYRAQMLECIAHRDIVRIVRALQTIQTDVRLREFEENYLAHLSRVYSDLGDLLDDNSAFSWLLVNSVEMERLRPVFIANVAALFAELLAAAGLRGHYSRARRSSPESACLVVSELAAELDAWLRRQPKVREESITDWLLYQLTERASWIKYYQFPRHEEARESGADWEWWLISDRESFGMRVQAKNLCGHDDSYPQIAYANRHGLQIEKLIEAARRFNVLPLYALYYTSPTSPTVRCHDPSDDAGPYAVFLTDAILVHQKYVLKGRQRITSAQLLADSCPLACLFCCAAEARDNAAPFVGKVFEFIRRYFAAAANVVPGLHEQPPPYVEALLQATEDEVPTWISTEFGERLRNVSAVLTFDLRTPSR
ncbi:MAG TPA: DUF6615 family protein [Longimicrobium sp.]